MHDARDFDQLYSKTVGWGHNNPKLQQPYDVKALAADE